MKHYQVVVTPNAEEDIERNARWWAEHHSLGQALRWIEVVEEQLQALATLPEAHSTAPENNDYSFEIREKLVGLGSRPGYRAIYAIRDDSVFVLAVRRGAQGRVDPGELDLPE